MDEQEMSKKPKGRRWTPSNWAGWKPFGIGEQRPNNYKEIIKAFWDNRDQLPYAWRILNQGVCDGCALGTTGMRDWTLDGVHLCNIRLRLLRLNTAPALDDRILEDIAPLAGKRAEELRVLGRLSHPLVRRKGDRGFRRVSWEEVLDLMAGRIRTAASQPDGATGRVGFYLTSRGMTNEGYYAAQKAARAMGTASIDNAARVCHAPSTVGLRHALGVASTTCSYTDWIGSDLVVFIGSNVANNQPVAIKYLHYAKKAGTKVVVINTYREPGMERYWVPSVVESALFGTKIADRFFLINVGGDTPFLNGALKCLLEEGLVDREFIARHTNGIEDLQASLESQSFEELERLSGSTREEMREFARMVGQARTAVLVWSMGVTQHDFGENTVSAIINLGLARGFVGREKCGLMPIHGHSGVQGGAEMGAYATALPGGLAVTPDNAVRLAEIWGFPIPDRPGMTAPEMIDAAGEGRLEVLFSAGGNFLDVLPDPAYVRGALEKIPLRVHMDIVLSPQMFVDPADVVVLLPATTRYEIPGGVTQTSTERRVMFSPEIPGRRIGVARPEWDVLLDLARRVRPDLADRLRYEDTAALRKEIARVVPAYDGIQNLKKAGDQFQYGGPHLCADWRFPTTDGKAHFALTPLPRREVPEGSFVVATRRGKQFNSMMHEKKDALNGAVREAVLINPQDASRLGLGEGDPLVLRSDFGELRGRALLAPVKAGTLQVHWPEGNVLIDRRRRSQRSGVPDYNAVVRIETVNGAKP